MTKTQYREWLKKLQWDIGNEIVTVLKRTCPVNGGRLKNSIKQRTEGKGVNIYMVDYALHVEYGTAPHIIRPVNGKALKFKGSNGEDVFAKQVNHPGTRPQPFIRPMIINELPRIVEESVRRAL